MSTCRWDPEAGDYMVDGEPCRVDEYGDPTKHCTARRSCSVHIGRDELTCPRCIARVRSNLRRIPVLAALMDPVAWTTGVNSEAANLAGPAADPEAWSWHRIAVASATGGTIGDGTDETHPLTVLGTWDMMIREDYDHPSDQPVTVANAADYLDRQLARIANDPDQDWPLFAAEVRRCRRHLEAVSALAAHRQRGAPCPECAAHRQAIHADLVARQVPESEWPKITVPRLVRHYGHWCDDETCEKVHYDQRWDREAQRYVPDPSGDEWVCPRCDARWEHEQYERYIEERRVGA